MNNTMPPGADRDRKVEQELGELRRRYELLHEKRVRTEQDMSNLSRQLDTLREQAMERYGTSDISELQQLLEEKRQQNERLVAEYKEHITTIQNDLLTVENQIDNGQ